MSKMTRRDLLATALVVGGGIALNPSTAFGAVAERPVYEPKPLPFNPASLHGISEKLIVAHHDKNYAGAVKRIAAIHDKIRGLLPDAPPFQLGSLKREELIATNSMILHEHYFDNLGGDGKIGGNIGKAIAEQFGSYEAWEHEFRQTGQALGGGSGWVILTHSPHTKRLHNVWSSDHTQTLAGGKPILVMDMYEHAYQMDYGPDAKAYIDAFFKNINWETAEKRLA